MMTIQEQIEWLSELGYSHYELMNTMAKMNVENTEMREVLERWRHAAVLTDTPLMAATCEVLGYPIKGTHLEVVLSKDGES